MKLTVLPALSFLLLNYGEAAHIPFPVEKRANCAVITGALSVLKQLQGPATTFCSSYLHLSSGGGTSTVTSVTTATVVTTGATITTTYTGSTEPAGLKKRTIEARVPGTTPAGLSKYPAASISSACSCLSLTGGGTPTTTTVLSTTTTTSSVTATYTVCVADGAYCSFAPGAPPCCPGYACAAFSNGNYCYPE